MAFHFDNNTTIDRVHITDVIRALRDIKEFRPVSDRAALAVCVRHELVRPDPCAGDAYLLTDLGNSVGNGQIGERIPLANAKIRFDAFMNKVCRAFEADKTLPVRDADPLVVGWLFGSFIREEPTIGDIDIFISLPQGFRSDPFISVAEDHLDLTYLPIPCQAIKVILRGGRAEWEASGEIGYHPRNTVHYLHDPCEPVSLMTDEGVYRSGTPTLDEVTATLEEAAEVLRGEDILPLPLAATVRRDIIARYTDGANAEEAPAPLIDHVGNLRRNGIGAMAFREAIEKVMNDLMPSPEMCP